MKTYECGTEQAYLRGKCKCNTCREARFRRRKLYLNRQAKGEYLVDGHKAQVKIQGLLDEGFSWNAIRELLGLRLPLKRFMASERIHRSVHLKAMGLSRGKLFAVLPDEAKVPSVGTLRRIRALQAMGWPLHLIDEPGMLIARGVSKRGYAKVSLRVHRYIAERFRLLCMEQGPSEVARVMSDRVTPLMWDDIDDPKETPKR